MSKFILEEKDVIKLFDHSALKVTTTLGDVEKLCAEGLQFGVASVCVPPCYVAEARRLVGKKMKVSTVISFPNGYMTTAAKIFECKDAIKNGADELDVVANIGLIKKRRYDDITAELNAIRKACGKKIVKLIIETSHLSTDEQVAMCTIATSTKMDFVKTCTGFGSVATEDDVSRLVANVGAGVKVKASGGIQTMAQARRFIELGAARIGESCILSSPPGEALPESAPETGVHLAAENQNIESLPESENGENA